jgi:hypothetical protein
MFERGFWVEDLEFEDQETGVVDGEGKHALGEELLQAIGADF